MKEFFYKTVTGGLVSTVTYLLGGWDTMLSTLILLSALDFVTAIMANAYLGTVNSKAAYRGVIKKLGILVVVLIAHRLDHLGLAALTKGLIPFDSPSRTLVCFFFIGHEGISNLENLNKFLPLPSWLMKIFENIKESGEKK